jgi:hypothetical protein
MSKVLCLSANHDGTAAANSAAWTPVGSATSFNTIDSGINLTIGVAGTFSNLGSNWNATGTSRSIEFKVNTVVVNQANSIGNGASGWVTDSTNTDSVSAGDAIGLILSEGGANPTVFATRNVFSATSGTAYLIGAQSGFNFATASVTRYGPLHALNGGAYASTSTTAEEYKVRAAGTAKYFHTYVQANARTNNTVFAIVINGAAGNGTLTVGSGATGTFTDTSNTDTLASGDLVCQSITTGTGTEIMTIRACGVTITNATGLYDIAGGRTIGSTRAASATTHYFALGGRFGTGTIAQTTETQCSVAHTFIGRLSKARVYISANTYSTDATVRVRKDAGNGNQVITITAAGTGWFEDATNTDTFTATNLCNFSIVGGTSGSITMLTQAITGQETSDADGALSATGTGTASLVGAANANSPLSISGTGTATLVGESFADSPLSTSGTGTADFVGEDAGAGASFGDGALSVSGTGTASLVSAADANSPLSISGTGTASLVGESFADSPLSVSGDAAASFVGEDAGAGFGDGALSISGDAAASFVGVDATPVVPPVAPAASVGGVGGGRFPGAWRGVGKKKKKKLNELDDLIAKMRALTVPRQAAKSEALLEQALLVDASSTLDQIEAEIVNVRELLAEIDDEESILLLM